METGSEHSTPQISIHVASLKSASADAKAHTSMPTKAKVTLASEPTEKMTAEETKPEVKGIKMEDVEKHSSVDDLWLVIDGACRDQIWNENVHSRAGAARASAPPSSRRPLRCVLPTRI